MHLRVLRLRGVGRLSGRASSRSEGRPSRRPPHRLLARGCFALAATALLLYPVNLAVYSGWGGGGLTWRLEHGRLRITCSEREVRQTFYVAPNSEALRFAPEGRWHGIGDWEVQVPLWSAALTALTAGALLARRRPTADAG